MRFHKVKPKEDTSLQTECTVLLVPKRHWAYPALFIFLFKPIYFLLIYHFIYLYFCIVDRTIAIKKISEYLEDICTYA